MGSLFRECEFGGIDLLDCENTLTNTPFCEGMLAYFKLLSVALKDSLRKILS